MQRIDETIAAALKGEKISTARLISLVERGDKHAPYILQKIYPHAGRAYYIGVTGAPGAGKSTMVDKLVKWFCKNNYSVGIIAVDPSSPFSGGALLGDRIRVNIKRKEYDYFFRSMTAGNITGGLSRTTREAARILAASGREIIIIETVGVGQSELDIAKAADTVVVMMTPESGDTIQIMKAGLIEIADIFVVNKCDRRGAETIAHGLKAMLDRIEKTMEWRPPIFMTSASLNQGIDALYAGLWDHYNYLKTDNKLEGRRRGQLEEELKRRVELEFARLLWREIDNDDHLDEILQNVWNNSMDPQNAARKIVETWLQKK